MKQLPQRTSLATQAATAILEEIRSGRWVGWLPGENELAESLHVSRNTVRKALLELSRDGIVRSHQGRRREIMAQRPRIPAATSNRVVLLMPDPYQGFLHRAFLIDRLREHLAEEGYLLETHVSRIPFRARSQAEFEKLAKRLRPAGWVLMSSTEELQKWFVARALPCVVAGTLYDGIDLPSVDVDYKEVCQHAVEQFIARGHERIALLNPFPGAAGETVTEAGFQEAVTRSNRDTTVIRHDGTVENICSKLDAALRRRNAPTAFLVSRARHTLTVLSYLAQKGHKVPADIAVISRDDESYLDDVVPSVTRYSSNPNLFAARLSRSVLEMVRGRKQSTNHKIASTFIRGKTL